MPALRVVMAMVLLAACAVADSADRPPPRKQDLARAIYFDSNSTALRPDAYPVLVEWAAYLRHRSTDETVQLEGHADQRGDPDYNSVLAEQRAMSVLHVLVALGVDVELIEVVSAGDRSPQAFGHTAFAWSRNRRVELQLK